MLKSLPVKNASELWKVGDKDRCCNWGGYTQGDDADFALFSGEAYQHFRAHTQEFVDLAALQATVIGVAPPGSGPLSYYFKPFKALATRSMGIPSPVPHLWYSKTRPTLSISTDPNRAGAS